VIRDITYLRRFLPRINPNSPTQPPTWPTPLVRSLFDCPVAAGVCRCRPLLTPTLQLLTDRVFVHALNTVKKIPKTGAARPPPGDRMRLYGLYKQAMEGDVDGVMERPNTYSVLSVDELRREQDKWDAWNAQRGLGRTEAKRRYIESLIETMHTYATTP